MIALSVEDIEKRIADSYELSNNVLQKIPEPLVSVRTSTYNHGKYIKYCIEGVLMQKTTFPFEFIIGEDCSTDETREIVFEYAKKYPDIIRVITADYNVGSKANGRRCIRACRGKYMAICEGDDYWIDPYKLQKQVDFLEEHPEYVLIYTNAEKVNSKSEKVLRNSLKGVSGDITRYLFYRGNPVVTATVCYRRKYLLDYQTEIKKMPFKMKMGDLPLWIYLSLQGKFKYMHDKTTAYRVLQESASHSKDKEKMISFITNTRDILLYFNRQYDIGVPERVIEKRYYKSLIRNMASFSKKDFRDNHWYGIKRYPTLLFDLKLWILWTLRVIFNQKC